MGKSILKLLNFDINMTKFGCSLQVIPLPSLPLPLCQYISKLICTMYLPTVQHLSMVYCTVTVFLSTVSIYFSLYLYLSTVFTVHISSVFICLQIFLIVYCIYSKYSIYFSTVFIYLFYTAPIYLLCKAIFSALLSTVKMPFYLFYSALLYYCV